MLTRNEQDGNMLRKFEHPNLNFSFPIISTGATGVASTEFLPKFKTYLRENSWFTGEEWQEAMNSGGTSKKLTIYTAESAYINKVLSLKAHGGGAKVLLMWLPELLQDTTANKLLKLIEEPPDNTYFILATHDVEKVLPTIRSRTQPVLLPMPTSQSLADVLVSNFGTSHNMASFVAGASEGSLGRAINMARSSDDASVVFTMFREAMRMCYKKEAEKLPEIVDQISGLKREELRMFMDSGIRLFRMAMLHRIGVNINEYLQGDALDFSKKFAFLVDDVSAAELYELYNDAAYHVDRNANAKILLMDLLLKTTVVMSKAAKRTEVKS
jgi:DNA polymerase-3 subunit delta'